MVSHWTCYGDSYRREIPGGGDCDQSHLIYVFFLDYGERAGSQSGTVPGTKVVVKPIGMSSPEKQSPKSSDQVTIY